MADNVRAFVVNSLNQFNTYLSENILPEYATYAAIETMGYVTKTDLSSQGYLTSIPSTYATYAAISNMSYVTSTQLSNQGYLTSETPLSLSGSKNAGGGTQFISELNTNGHEIIVTYSVVPAGATLSLSGAENGGNGKYISGISVLDHAITLTYDTIPSLSKGYVSGSGNVVTDINVSGHSITFTKGITALTEETQLSLTEVNNTSGKYISALSVNNHQITATYTLLPSETNVTITSVTKPADSGNYTYVINGVSSNAHTITPTYTGVLKSHQDISGKEDISNKKTDLTSASNVNATYYPSTSAVTSYVMTYIGSLEAFTTDELNSIFVGL